MFYKVSLRTLCESDEYLKMIRCRLLVMIFFARVPFALLLLEKRPVHLSYVLVRRIEREFPVLVNSAEPLIVRIRLKLALAIVHEQLQLLARRLLPLRTLLLLASAWPLALPELLVALRLRHLPVSFQSRLLLLEKLLLLLPPLLLLALVLLVRVLALLLFALPHALLQLLTQSREPPHQLLPAYTHTETQIKASRTCLS